MEKGMENAAQQFIDSVNFDIRKEDDRLRGAITTSMGAGKTKKVLVLNQIMNFVML